MLKQIKRQDINYHLHDTIAHVKTFPGATSEDMKSYIEPTLKSKPDEIILHCGTNDLRNEEPQEIAEKIAARNSSPRAESNLIGTNTKNRLPRTGIEEKSSKCLPFGKATR